MPPKVKDDKVSHRELEVKVCAKWVAKLRVIDVWYEEQEQVCEGSKVHSDCKDTRGSSRKEQGGGKLLRSFGESRRFS